MLNRLVPVTFPACMLFVAFGCFLLGDEGRLVLINEANRAFYYQIVVADSVAGLDQPYSVDPSKTDLPKLEPGEKHTIDLREKYAEQDIVTVLIYATTEETAHKAERVRMETMGVAFLEATYWAPVRITEL